MVKFDGSHNRRLLDTMKGVDNRFVVGSMSRIYNFKLDNYHLYHSTSFIQTFLINNLMLSSVYLNSNVEKCISHNLDRIIILTLERQIFKMLVSSPYNSLDIMGDIHKNNDDQIL